MRRSELFVLHRSLWLPATICFTIFTVRVDAAPPVEEIRTIMAKRALASPSPSVLSTLNSKNLGSGLRAIDPYARYMPSAPVSGKSSESLYLGLEIFAYNSRIWLRPDPDGSAAQAGIPEISELLAINGKKLGADLEQTASRIDTAIRLGDVTLTVSEQSGRNEKSYRIRPGSNQPASFNCRRSGGDMVVRINEFVSHDTAPGLSASLTTLLRPGDRIVLDLRGCAGGDLFEALEIAGMFVPAGLPLASTYDRARTVRTYRSPAGKKLRKPFLILIDRRTASAAEILAGILQYHHLGHIVGERSYGKCVSQTLVPLSDGGELWLTTLGINLPNATSCVGRGLEPDRAYANVSVAQVNEIIKSISSGVNKLP